MIKIKFKDKIFNSKDSISKVPQSFYDQLYLIKQTSNARYNSDDKVWIIEAKVSNYKIIKNIFEDDLLIYVKELIESKKKDAKIKDIIKEESYNIIKHKYPFLYPFQVSAVTDIISSKHRKFLISLSTGLGKTLVSLSIFDYFKIEKKLIICPSSLKQQWSEEIKKWFGKDSIIVEGSKAKRLKIYEKECEYFIIGYETLRNDIKEPLLYNKLKSYNIICDEVHKLKNKKSQLYKTFLILNKIIDRVLFLTATPISNGLMDIHNIVELIDKSLVKKINNFVVKEQQNVGWGHNAKIFWKIVGYKNLDEYSNLIKPIFIKKLKEEVMNDLPDKIINNINIKFDTKYTKIYDQIIDNIGPFSGFTLLQMLDNGIDVLQSSKSESRELIDFPKISTNPKLDYLKELVEDITQSNEQIIIFSHFIKSADIITKTLQKSFKDLRIECTNNSDKDSLRNNFNNKNINILVTTDTFSTGVSFPNVQYHINFDILTNYTTWIQRQDRTHRINSNNKTIIYNLIGSNIEKHIINLLDRKQILVNKIMKGEKNIKDIDIKAELLNILK